MILNYWKKISLVYKVYIIFFLLEELFKIFLCYTKNIYFCSIALIVEIRFSNIFYFEFGRIYLYIVFLFIYIITKLKIHKKIEGNKILSISFGLLLVSFSNLYGFLPNSGIIEYIKFLDYKTFESYFDCSSIITNLHLYNFSSLSHVYAFIGIILLFYSFILKDIKFLMNKNRKFTKILIFIGSLKYLSFPILIYILDPLGFYYSDRHISICQPNNSVIHHYPIKEYNNGKIYVRPPIVTSSTKNK